MTLIAGILSTTLYLISPLLFLAYLISFFSLSLLSCFSFSTICCSSFNSSCLVLTSDCWFSTSFFLSSIVFSFSFIWYFNSSLSSFLSQRFYMDLLSWSKNLAPTMESLAYWSSSSLYSSYVLSYFFII